MATTPTNKVGLCFVRFVAWLLMFTRSVSALDNGLRLPPMGWSSWYGFTQNVNETLLRDIADGMVSSGLHEVGFEHIWLDDGWAVGRDNKTGHVIVDPVLFPSGMRNLSDYIHSKGLKFGIYTSKGPLTCLGYQPTQPDRPGSCGFEQIDADVYAHEWQVDQVKDDGCGACPQHEPFAAMRDALNKTGKPIWYAIHSTTAPGSPSNGTVANMWRTGGDLSSSSFDMWTNRLDLATTPAEHALAGPGAFPNPDFLEVGYSPRMSPERSQTVVEQQAMFTMWSALPGPLILSADLRSGRGGLDGVESILMNREVIAINQDAKAAPMQPMRRNGVEVWKKPLTNGYAVIVFYRNTTGAAAQNVVTMSSNCGTPLAMSFVNGTMQTRQNSSLCLGSIGICSCSNPPSPRMGLVPCNSGDTTQRWSYDPSTNQINNDAKHDLNVASKCPGEQNDNNLLLYPTQGHNNEKYSFNESSGVIKSLSGNCLSIGSGDSQAPINVDITWEELDIPQHSYAIRDLWNQSGYAGNDTGFSVLVQWHQARIFTLIPH